jgi:hypothetical protein
MSRGIISRLHKHFARNLRDFPITTVRHLPRS